MKNKNRSIGYRTLLVVLCCIFVYSAFQTGKILYNYYIGTKIYTNIQKEAGTEDGLGEIDFDALAKENSDIKGWIYSENTLINYPIVQGRDNSYYLTHTFDEQYNPKGSIFIDANNPEPFKDFNTIIYGHRMKDRSMFNSIAEYKDEKFYKKNKKMIIVTPEEKFNLEIFSIMTIPANSDLYRISFNSDMEKQEYIDYIQSHSETKMPVDVKKTDNIVMLSTCTNVNENERIVVYGKLSEFNKEK